MTTPGRAPAAFATSVRDRLKVEAKRRGRPFNELEREFILQRFLARVFADSASPWVLKGGTGLLIRLPDARHSRDLDWTAGISSDFRPGYDSCATSRRRMP